MNTLVPVLFEIGKNITLAEVEERLDAAEKCEAEAETVVHLARHVGSNFFVDSRIAALIATLAKRTTLTVRDWHKEWVTSEVNRFFKARLTGFTALMKAREVENDCAEALPLTPAGVRAETNSRGGVLERHIAVQRPIGNAPFLSGIEMTHHPEGRSLTICSVDSSEQRATPFVFSGLMQNREKFAETFLRLKRRHLEMGQTSGFENMQQLAAENALATFVFETFQNSFEHGCFDERGGIISGVRSIMLRKHVSNAPSAFVSRAASYPALEEYVNRAIAPSRHTKLLEVSISDEGLGILGRYRSTCDRTQDKPALSASDDRVLLRRIIEEPLTSKRSFPGAGQGLSRVTDAVQAIDGFLAVRTGRVWLSYGMTAGSYGFEELDVAPIRGTHINLLFPLRSV
jgi:hypothetical protein